MISSASDGGGAFSLVLASRSVSVGAWVWITCTVLSPAQETNRRPSFASGHLIGSQADVDAQCLLAGFHVDGADGFVAPVAGEKKFAVDADRAGIWMRRRSSIWLRTFSSDGIDDPDLARRLRCRCKACRFWDRRPGRRRKLSFCDSRLGAEMNRPGLARAFAVKVEDVKRVGVSAADEDFLAVGGKRQAVERAIERDPLLGLLGLQIDQRHAVPPSRDRRRRASCRPARWPSSAAGR